MKKVTMIQMYGEIWFRYNKWREVERGSSLCLLEDGFADEV